MKSEEDLERIKFIKSLRVMLDGVVYGYISDAEMKIADAKVL